MFSCLAMGKQMARLLHRRAARSQLIARLVSIFVIVSFVLCIVTPMVFWGVRIGRSLSSRVAVSVSCSSCVCDCFEDFLPITYEPINNSSSSADGDPEMMEEMKKDMSTLIKEEMSLLKIVTDDNMQRYKSLTVNTKKTTSRYQKEADKCNTGVRICEQARERAQEELVKERQLTALWKQRAQNLSSP